MSVCAGKIFKDRESRADVKTEGREVEAGGSEGGREKKTDRQREGLSFGLQTTVLFQNWSRMHRAPWGECVPLQGA